ncbi:MAG: ABC transporter ATP-binding protein [Persicimonas sp.]
MSSNKKKRRWARLRRALAYAKPYKKPIAVILSLTLVGAGVGAVEPLVMKHIFDQLGESGTLESVLMALGLLVGLALLKEAADGVSNWLTWRTRIGIQYALLEESVDSLQRLPESYHSGESTGAVLTRLQKGIDGFVDAVSQISFEILPAFAYLVFAAIAMIDLDWRLFLVVMAFVPLPAVIAAWAAPEQTRRERKLLDKWSAIYGRFNEVLRSISLVRSFAMEDREKERFLNRVDDTNEVVVRGVGFDTSVEAASNVVVMGARIAAVGVGAWLIFEGEVTVGTLVAFMGYVEGLFGPVQGLTGVHEKVVKATAAVDEVFDILDAESPVPDAPDAVDPGPLHGAVTFDEVTFSYDEGEEVVLDGIDLHVEPGETVALVGPSGAGKSTMMALLQRFHDPCEGAVRLDGHDLRRLEQRKVRRRMGMVLQDALLFRDTIANNISYGRPDASREEIVAAARAAHAHDFITGFPDGYDTVVGESGSRLSAGERQRVAIARALIKDPPIMILDEATSALDAESEMLVQEAFDQLLEDRTAFIIAHRLSTVVRADRILVLKKGRIVEAGTHAELLDSRGYYAYLVEQQTGHVRMAS